MGADQMLSVGAIVFLPEDWTLYSAGLTFNIGIVIWIVRLLHSYTFFAFSLFSRKKSYQLSNSDANTLLHLANSRVLVRMPAILPSGC